MFCGEAANCIETLLSTIIAIKAMATYHGTYYYGV